jgi:hypothetical protein
MFPCAAEGFFTCFLTMFITSFDEFYVVFYEFYYMFFDVSLNMSGGFFWFDEFLNFQNVVYMFLTICYYDFNVLLNTSFDDFYTVLMTFISVFCRFVIRYLDDR